MRGRQRNKEIPHDVLGRVERSGHVVPKFSGYNPDKTDLHPNILSTSPTTSSYNTPYVLPQPGIREPQTGRVANVYDI